MTPSSRPAPRVLVTNDDGPPSGPDGHSPFIYPFVQALQKELGWDVRVVVPSIQKSWAGKSYLISETTTGHYYYPAGEDGAKGERSDLPKAGGAVPWVLVDGTPATCANLALHSLYPPDSFDMCIAGPNFGRNTSTAFALSSGTIGSALSAALTGLPSIALSLGLMTGYKPPPQNLVDGAVKAACSVVKQLWEMGWGEGADKVDVYTVNVPILPSVLAPGGPEIQWTTMARTQYQRLFKSIAKAPEAKPAFSGDGEDDGGPAAIPENPDETVRVPQDKEGDCVRFRDEHNTRPLKFIFSPDIGPLVNPNENSLVEGTDSHTLHSGAISVTPIRAAFEPAATPPHKFKKAGL
ncbi:sure-like protein [Meredithblackwellia eburnea MCA 4105]